MIIILFGVPNVGKTVTGKKLAEKLNYKFFDLDQEIKTRLNTTLENFVNNNFFQDTKDKIKSGILKDIVYEHKENIVIASSLIYYTKNYNILYKLKNFFPIELQDTKENIFERLVFYDENDMLIKDDEYKFKHKNHYLKEIQKCISETKQTFKRIKNKYFIDNKPVDKVVDDLIILIKKNYISE